MILVEKSLSTWWDRSLRQPAAARLSASNATRIVATIGIGIMSALLIAAMKHGLGYTEIVMHDVSIVLLAVLLGAIQLVPSGRRTHALAVASVVWQLALTSPITSISAILSAVGAYYVVLRPNLSTVRRACLLTPLIGVFFASGWTAFSGFGDTWTPVKGIYAFGWGAMILRLIYFVAEGPAIRRATTGHRIGEFLIFMFFYPFTVKLVVMSFVEFTRSAVGPENIAVRLRGLEITAMAGLKCLAIIGLHHLILSSRQHMADGRAVETVQTLHLWLETCSPYVLGYLAMSLNFDLGTAWSRMFGWNLESAFRNPLLARNMKELWVQWNVFFRQALVNLVYYPLVRFMGNPHRAGRQAAALIVACVATFLMSAAVHIVFWGWTPLPSVAYFILQSVPVAFVLVHEHVAMQRARALRRPPPARDPLLTPLFIIITGVYQSLLHFHFRDPHESFSESMRMFLAAPVRLFLPLITGQGYLMACGLVGLLIVRRQTRAPDRDTNRARWRMGTTLALTTCFAWVTWGPAQRTIPMLRAWTDRIAVGAEWCVIRGIALYRQGRPDEALAQFQAALRFSSHPIDAREQSALLYAERGQYQLAAEEARQVLDVDPTREPARTTLAAIMQMEGRIDEAINQLRMALEINPRAVLAGRNLAKIFLQREDVASAMEVYQRLRSAVPGHPDVMHDLGLALTIQRRYADAFLILREGATLHPDHEPIAVRLIWLLAATPNAAQRNGPEAVRLAERIAESGRSQSPPALEALAIAYAEVERFDEAVQAAQRAEQIARAAGLTQLAEQMATRVQQFKRHQRIRLPA